MSEATPPRSSRSGAAGPGDFPRGVQTRPKGAPHMGQCGVASLGKGRAIPGGTRLALAHVWGSEL
jgi:hypothetical protein